MAVNRRGISSGRVKKRQSTGVPQKDAARYVVDCSEETINTTDCWLFTVRVKKRQSTGVPQKDAARYVVGFP